MAMTTPPTVVRWQARWRPATVVIAIAVLLVAPAAPFQHAGGLSLRRNAGHAPMSMMAAKRRKGHGEKMANKGAPVSHGAQTDETDKARRVLLRQIRDHEVALPIGAMLPPKAESMARAPTPPSEALTRAKAVVAVAEVLGARGKKADALEKLEDLVISGKLEKTPDLLLEASQALLAETRNLAPNMKALVAAVCCAFRLGEVALGQSFLVEAKATALIRKPSTRNAFIVALCDGSRIPGSGAEAFRFALRILEEVRSADGGGDPLSARAIGALMEAIGVSGGDGRQGSTGAEELISDPRERLVMCEELLIDTRAWGLKPPPSAGAAIANSAFRATLEEGSAGMHMSLQQLVARTERSAQGGTSDGHEQEQGQRQGGAGQSGRRYTSRRAMQAAQEALHRNRLGWGYGAAHVILESSVRLGDMDTAKDCMGKLSKAGLAPKRETWHALLRPLAANGDALGAVNVLTQMADMTLEGRAEAEQEMEEAEEEAEEEAQEEAQEEAGDGNNRDVQEVVAEGGEGDEGAKTKANTKGKTAARSYSPEQLRDICLSTSQAEAVRDLDDGSVALVIDALVGTPAMHPLGRFLLEQRGLLEGGSRVGGVEPTPAPQPASVEVSVDADDNSVELWDSRVRWQLVAENTTDVGRLLRKMGSVSVHGLPGVHTTSIIAEGLSAARGAAGRRIARHFLAALGTAPGSGGAAVTKSAVMVAAREAVMGVGANNGAIDGTTSEDELATLLPRTRRSNFHRLLIVAAESEDSKCATGVISDLENMYSKNVQAGPLKVPNRLPDRDLYSSAIEACVADGQMEAALDQVDALDRRGLKPTQAGYVAIMRGFGVALALGDALGVWEELKTTARRPSRVAYQTAIDACVAHPRGLKNACELMAKMRTDGYSLSSAHHDTLILGFRQARNLEAALLVFRDQSRQRGFARVEVGEETLAALLEACRRSGDVDSLEEAVGLLCEYGVQPPPLLMKYLGTRGEKRVAEGALYKQFFKGEEQEKRELAATMTADANMRRIKAQMNDIWDEAMIDVLGERGDGSRAGDGGDRGETGEEGAKKQEPPRVWTFNGKVASMRYADPEPVLPDRP